MDLSNLPQFLYVVGGTLGAGIVAFMFAYGIHDSLNASLFTSPKIDRPAANTSDPSAK